MTCCLDCPLCQVISTTLRKSNEDSHYCNALELNVKAFLQDADLVLDREFKVLLEHREQQDRARQAGQGSGWGAVLNNPDAAISTGDIERYLTATLERIVRVSNDDKCKVPTGEPGNPVGTNVRPMAAGVALKSVRLLAMDHSWHRASITPTVTLLSDVAHGFETGNWRHGQLVVSIKDSVLEPSSAFRNAAELATTVLAACAKPIILDKRTDGGPEQNTTFGSVQLADVALWKKTGVDLCIHQRPAADNSWINEVEGCMPLLNLGMQHQATARLRMDPKFEDLFANEGSMSAVRAKIDSIEDASERQAAEAAWLASLHGSGGPIELLQQRFGRLIYTDRTLKIQPVATSEEIAAMHALVSGIDTSWRPEMTTKPALLKLEKLQRFLEKHTIRDKYIVCVFKCGDADCEFGCGPLRMPRAAFEELIGNRLKAKCKIVPHPEHTTASGSEHFDKYPNLKGRPTSEKHMPSFKPITEPSGIDKRADQQTAKAAAQRSGNPKADLWHAASARCTIGCSECGLPRVLYSLNRLSPEEKDIAQSAVDNVSSFVCGATQLFDEGHQLASKLFVRSANACGLPVEKQYYTSKQFRDCCTWCGLTDPLELEDLESLNLNGAKGYSICKRCYADGKKVITFGKATKTAVHKSKAKGRKRAKKGVVDSSEEEEEDEDGDEEEEDVNEGEGEGEGEGEEDEDEGEGEGKDGDHQYEVEIILAKKEFTEPRKGKVMKWAVKWQGYDETSQMTWEPAGNLTNVRTEVDAFERRLVSMPSLTAFTAPAGSSACCFGSTCRHQSDLETTQNPCSVCSKNMHHMCASEHLFLKPFYSELEHVNVCFDCSLLIALVEKRTPFGLTGAQLMFEPYYRQLRGVASLAPTPFGLGALLTTKALKLFEPDALMARTLPTPAKCLACKSAEGELRACSFCKSGIYHDNANCLGEQRASEASLTYKSFPWCCPKCFQRGKVALEKILLGPSQTNKRRR